MLLIQSLLNSIRLVFQISFSSKTKYEFTVGMSVLANPLNSLYAVGTTDPKSQASIFSLKHGNLVSIKNMPEQDTKFSVALN